MRNLLLLSALCLGVSAAGHADTTFYLIGNTYTFDNINNTTPPATLTGTATGTVNIDTVAGVFDSVNVDVTIGATDYIFTGPPVTQSSNDPNFPNQSYEYTFDSGGDSLTIDLPGSSLVGFAGGPLCSVDNLCSGYVGDLLLADGVTNYAAMDGSLEPTPEPSSLILLGTGLLGTVGAMRRRWLSRGA